MKGSADHPVAIDFVFYRDTLRRFDLDNAVSSCLDVLVKGGLLKDDSFDWVPEFSAHYGGVDKKNPRAEMFITEILDE